MMVMNFMFLIEKSEFLKHLPNDILTYIKIMKPNGKVVKVLISAYNPAVLCQEILETWSPWVA